MALNILKNAEAEAQKVRDTHDDPLAVVLLTKYCLAVFSNERFHNSILSRLRDLAPLQFYFSPFLISWEMRTNSKITKKGLGSKLSLRLLFDLIKMRMRTRRYSLQDLWESVQKANENRYLYFLPWNEVLETNQNEFLYSILEMLMAGKLREQYSHHSRP